SRLDELRALELLAAYGIPTAPGVMARTVEEAVAAAERFGYPVVLKIMAPDIVHKTDVGGVQVGIGNAEELRSGFADIMARARRRRPEAAISGVLVQPMRSGGRELIIGMVRDPAMGPLLMFGLGGTLVEVLGDVVFRLAPIHRLDAEDLIGGIRGVRLLDGVRGAAPVDRAALTAILLRVSRLVTDFPAIAELDLNPVLAFAEGALAVDARVLLAPPETAA
ncbi:MAG TPA: acetate--CoA ligase family protein, partial [Gemmatimonadales bacterium]|nr:acetate--CoA ligase family protein [Gemmatimonadales bacterium]